VGIVAETKAPIVTAGGMKVLPEYGLNDCPRLDVLAVPGGWGTRKEMNNTRLTEWIADRSQRVETFLKTMRAERKS
jgi:putative intracellular protease/amidase